MSWSVIASTAQQSSDTAGFTTTNLNTSGANLIIGFVCDLNESITFGDSKSNTWTPLTIRTGTIQIKGFYALNPTVGTGHNFTTLVGAGQFPSIGILAMSGASSFDQESGGTGSSASTGQPGSITAAENGELYVTACGFDVASITIDSGFTVANQIGLLTSTAFGMAICYKVQSTAAALNPTYTFSASATYAMGMATFKVSGGGGGGFFARRYYDMGIGGRLNV